MRGGYRTRSITLAVCLLLLLAGCGRSADSHLEKGYTLMEEGQYSAALEEYQAACEADPNDTTAQEAVQILSIYMQAQEAYDIGDEAAARAYLDQLPEAYRDYPVKEAIQSLQEALNWTHPAATAVPKQTAAPEPAETDAPDETDTDTAAAATAQDQIEDVLAEAESLLNANLYEDADEMLAGIEEATLTADQQRRANELRSRADEARAAAEKADSEHPENREFTAEEALKILNQKYGIEGDAAGLSPQYDADGDKYYEITAQIDSENAILTLQIYKDGYIREVSRTPLGVG